MSDFQCRSAQRLSGEVTVPGDKSISHRALIVASLAEGVSNIYDLLMGADNLATKAAMQAMGVKIEQPADNHLKVTGVGLHGLQAPRAPIDCGNAGTGMRLLTGLLAGQSFASTLIGDASLMTRPMRRIVDPLIQMGANVATTEQGTAPLDIQPATLQGIEYRLPIASAQVRSCLLLAGLYAQGETAVIEPAPTRDHLERMLLTFGYPVSIDAPRVALSAGGQLTATDIYVPGDISSAAFFIVAATITPNSDVTLKNIGINPTRLGVITILKLMGADILLFNERMQGGEPVADIRVRSATLKGITIPKSQVPLAIDEFPVIFIAAACAEGETQLRNAAELRVKESDRLATMAEGLTQLGIDNQTYSDGITVTGGQFQGGTVDSYGDHRIAMAFIVAACVAKAPVTIKDCDNINTSFPGFKALAGSLGFDIQ